MLCLALCAPPHAAQSRFDWANYDRNRPTVLSGVVWTAENLDGVVVIRIKTDPRGGFASTIWVVALGTPKELTAAGLMLELPLGVPVTATVWEHKVPGNKEARAQQVSFNRGEPITLR